MDRHWYRIQSNRLLTEGQREYANIVTHHASLAQLAEDLRAGPVVVTQVFIRPPPPPVSARSPASANC